MTHTAADLIRHVADLELTDEELLDIKATYAPATMEREYEVGQHVADALAQRGALAARLAREVLVQRAASAGPLGEVLAAVTVVLKPYLEERAAPDDRDAEQLEVERQNNESLAEELEVARGATERALDVGKSLRHQLEVEREICESTSKDLEAMRRTVEAQALEIRRLTGMTGQVAVNAAYERGKEEARGAFELALARASADIVTLREQLATKQTLVAALRADSPRGELHEAVERLVAGHPGAGLDLQYRPRGFEARTPYLPEEPAYGAEWPTQWRAQLRGVGEETPRALASDPVEALQALAEVLP